MMAVPRLNRIGTAALLWSVAPSWTNAQMRSRLQSTAKDVESAGWDNKTGYGLVDACKAAGMCPALTAFISGLDSIPPFTSCDYDDSVFGGIPGELTPKVAPLINGFPPVVERSNAQG